MNWVFDRTAAITRTTTEAIRFGWRRTYQPRKDLDRETKDQLPPFCCDHHRDQIITPTHDFRYYIVVRWIRSWWWSWRRVIDHIKLKNVRRWSPCWNMVAVVCELRGGCKSSSWGDLLLFDREIKWFNWSIYTSRPPVTSTDTGCPIAESATGSSRALQAVVQSRSTGWQSEIMIKYMELTAAATN